MEVGIQSQRNEGGVKAVFSESVTGKLSKQWDFPLVKGPCDEGDGEAGAKRRKVACVSEGGRILGLFSHSFAAKSYNNFKNKHVHQ